MPAGAYMGRLSSRLGMFTCPVPCPDDGLKSLVCHLKGRLADMLYILDCDELFGGQMTDVGQAAVCSISSLYAATMCIL